MPDSPLDGVRSPLGPKRGGGTPPVDPATSVQLYTRSGDTILDRANSIIERRTV